MLADASGGPVTVVDYVFLTLSVLVALVTGPWFARQWLRERRTAQSGALERDRAAPERAGRL